MRRGGGGYHYYEEGRRYELQGLRHHSDRGLQDDVKGGATKNPFFEINDIVLLAEDGHGDARRMDNIVVQTTIKQAYRAGTKNVISKLQTDGKFTRLNQKG